MDDVRGVYDAFRDSIGDALEYRDHHIDGYIGVQTPLLMPDGEVVTVFVRACDDLFEVTDFGGLNDWIASVVGLDRAVDASGHTSTLGQYAVDCIKGELLVSAPSDGLADAVLRVAATMTAIGWEEYSRPL